MTPVRLGFGQRLVIVVGLGAALAAIGDFITSLGGGFPTGWTGYAPLQLRGLPQAGLSAGPRLAVWLVITALWMAVSLFLLRERPAAPGSVSGPRAGAAPAPGAPEAPAAGPAQPPGTAP